MARLLDHRLDFTRYSPARRCGVADIIEASGHCVWGMCFAIDDAGLATLDRIEGFAADSDAYRRVELTVEMISTDCPEFTERVWTYQVANPRPFIHPSPAYLRHLIEGALHWRLPKEWIHKLSSVAVQGS